VKCSLKLHVVTPENTIKTGKSRELGIRSWKFCLINFLELKFWKRLKNKVEKGAKYVVVVWLLNK